MNNTKKLANEYTKIGSKVECVVTGNVGILFEINEDDPHYMYVRDLNTNQVYKYSDNTLYVTE